jgi:GTPase SAR1 family protein
MGPEGAGKTTFIHQYLHSTLFHFVDSIVESTEMKIPTDALMAYIILPKSNLLAQRNPNIDVSVIGEWMKFYYDISSLIKVKLIEDDK